MKKVFVLILIFGIFSSTAYSAPKKNATTAELLSYIRKKAANCKIIKMKQAWEQLCEQDKETCAEKQEWFDNLLYETKIRQRSISSFNIGVFSIMQEIKKDQ